MLDNVCTVIVIVYPIHSALSALKITVCTVSKEHDKDCTRTRIQKTVQTRQDIYKECLQEFCLNYLLLNFLDVYCIYHLVTCSYLILLELLTINF